MKTDRDFLDGIYQKAERLQAEKETETAKPKITILQKQIVPIVAAAALLAVILPVAWFNRSFPMKEQEASPQGRSVMPFAIDIEIEPVELSTQELSDQSEYVLRGKVDKIEKSVYENENNITTDVIIKKTEVYKNEIYSKKIRLRINGGTMEKEQAYIPYDAFFEKGEDVLLFLNKKDGYYTLSVGQDSKFTYQETKEKDRVYRNTNGKTISVSELTD